MEFVSCANKAHAADCKKIGSVCIEEGGFREVEGFRVHRNCWKYKDKFECTFPSKKDCKPLVDEGCYQVKSECLAKVHDKCVNYKQTYNCVRETVKEFTRMQKATDITNQEIDQSNCEGEIRCLDGSCGDTTYKPNNEMGNAIAQLSALSEMRKYITGDFDANSVSIFKGDQGDNACSIGIVDSFDCCGEDDGWAVSLSLTKCKSNELALHKKREERKCVRVGSFCAEKVLGVCIRHKVNYCCFDNKLLRTIQEQGRAQLGIGWGSPEYPNCRGFSTEELSRIDFSKLDLSEFASDVISNYQKKAETLSKIQDKLKGEIDLMLKSFEQNPRQAPIKEGAK
jgi:hypothetical protein